MSNSKGATKLAVNQTLTNSYVVTNTIGSVFVGGESTATVDFSYTTGTSETGTSLSYIIETSIDESTWVQETLSTITSSSDAQTNLAHTFGGGAGSTAYTSQLFFPTTFRYMRVKVKETGVSSHFGTVNVNLTVASGSGMIRNTTVITTIPSGTQDVNLTKVGGAAVTLGQKTSAASIPVVLPSDQAFATSTKQSDGSQKTQIVDGSGNVIGSTTNALDINIKSGNPTTITATQGTGTNLHTVVDSGSITAAQATAANLKTEAHLYDSSTNGISSTGNALDVNLKTSALSNQSVNLSQVAGGTAINSGVTGAVAAGGDTANGVADAGNPLKIGGIATTTIPTAVSTTQRVAAQFDKYGRQIVSEGSDDMKGVQQTTITSSTSETTIITADATYKLRLYGLVLTNTSTTYTKVTIKDSTTGTTRFVFSVPSQDTRGFMLPISGGHVQATANNNWTATCGTSVASIEITALYLKTL